MSLITKINDDFKDAYKAQDFVKKNFLSLIKGTIQTNQSKGLDPSIDKNVYTVIKQLEKGIKESIEAGVKAGVDNSVLEQELEYLKVYTPELMTEDEIKAALIPIIEAMPKKVVGAIMGKFNQEYKEKYFDNLIVSKLIQELL